MKREFHKNFLNIIDNESLKKEIQNHYFLVNSRVEHTKNKVGGLLPP